MNAPVKATRIPAAAIRGLIADAMRKVGLSPADAETAAELMLEADLIGSDSHGVFRLAPYIRRLKLGGINPRPNITVTQSAPATALVDGDNALGHLVVARAAEKAVAMARECGVAWVGCRMSNHAGAAGVYAALPLKSDMIGMYAAVASSNHMPLTGGAEPLLGTNPVAIAIPAGEEPPVVFDIATSLVAFGTIRSHMLQNKPLPEGWMVDPETGESVTDPSKSDHALLLPMAGYKGAGLSLMLGLLAGTLNSAFFGRDVIDFNDQPEAVTNTGQFILALDPSRFQAIDKFKAEMDRQSRSLRASKMTPGQTARLPGDMRAQRRADRLQNGVSLKAELIAQLDKLAAELGITPICDRG